MPVRLNSIAALLETSAEQLARHLDLLVPEPLRHRFGLPDRGPWENGIGGTHRWVQGTRPGTLRVEVWPAPGGKDPALVVDLADHQFGKLEAAWIALNDVDGPRYSLDRDDGGRPIALGSSQRNLAEELRALAAGLAPNQVRPGLRMFRQLIHRVGEFALGLGADTLYVVPLAYHNAIQYERYGFTYASENAELEEIHRRFQAGGDLRDQLDGSTPFRMPALADTVRGRSWAIHDGILGDRWVPPSMYKFTDRDFTTSTCPGLPW